MLRTSEPIDSAATGVRSGRRAVVKAKPDGHTLLIGSLPLSTNPGLIAAARHRETLYATGRRNAGSLWPCDSRRNRALGATDTTAWTEGRVGAI